jgi:hypothetical protein
MKRTDAYGSSGGLYKESPDPATRVTGEAMNNLQEEICNVIELSGGALNPASRRQMYDAIAGMVTALTRFQTDTFASGPGPFALTHPPRAGGLVIRLFDGYWQPAANLVITGSSAALGAGVDRNGFDSLTVIYAY